MMARQDNLIRAISERQLIKCKNDGGDTYNNISGHMRSQAELLIQIIKDNPGIRSRKDCIHDSEWTQCLTLSALKMHFSISALLNKSFVTRRQHNAGGTFGSIQVMYWKPHNLKVVRKMVNPKISSALMVKCKYLAFHVSPCFTELVT